MGHSPIISQTNGGCDFPGFRAAGRIRPISARAAAGSPWTIGAETADRGYIAFSQIAPYLGPLGAPRVRVQAGWARCDVGDGMFNWDWLDRIVETAGDQGVRPWMQLSYGNPAYPQGGGVGLAEGLPSSPDALSAWDRWVTATVERYATKINDWEIWNEPDFRGIEQADRYVDLFRRTARAILRVQPDACVCGPALAKDLGFAEQFLRGLAASGDRELLTQFSFHGYPVNPDEGFDTVDALRTLLRRYAPHATLRQGETGAPSEASSLLALRGHEWSERKQAAWNLRRLLAHHARGIPASLFQIADMYYRREAGARFEGRNPKGLLWTDPDGAVIRPKLAYRVAQHVFTVFGPRYSLNERPRLKATSTTSEKVEAFSWTASDFDQPTIVAWWDAQNPPRVEQATLTRVRLPRQAMHAPMLIDFMTGRILEWVKPTTDQLWDSLPLCDTPLAIAERDTIPFD